MDGSDATYLIICQIPLIQFITVDVWRHYCVNDYACLELLHGGTVENDIFASWLTGIEICWKMLLDACVPSCSHFCTGVRPVAEAIHLFIYVVEVSGPLDCCY